MGDIKNILYTWLHKKRLQPSYQWRNTGLECDQSFMCECRIDGYDYIAVGYSISKKNAQANAARNFAEFLVQRGEMQTYELSNHRALNNTGPMGSTRMSQTDCESGSDAGTPPLPPCVLGPHRTFVTATSHRSSLSLKLGSHGPRQWSYHEASGAVREIMIKQILYTWLAKKRLQPNFNWKTTGCKHLQRFICKCRVNGYDYMAVSNSTNKKCAQTDAARNFAEFLVRQGEMQASDLPNHGLMTDSGMSQSDRESGSDAGTSQLPHKMLAMGYVASGGYAGRQSPDLPRYQRDPPQECLEAVTAKRAEGAGRGAVSLSYLWRGIVPGEPDSNLHTTLKTIYIRLRNGENPGVIAPYTIRNICLVLQSPTHAAHVKCVLCHVLKHLCVSEIITKLFIKGDLLKLLHTLLVQWTDRAMDILSPCEILLLNSELAVLETISHHHATFFTDFIQLDFLKPLCRLSGPQCSATYGYGSESYTAFDTLTNGVYPGLIGKPGKVHDDIRAEAYQECFGEKYEILNLPKTVLSVSLYDTSEQNDKDIAAEMRTLKGSWPLMEEVVPGMMGSAGINEVVVSEMEWQDVYVSSNVDGYHFWAQLGGKTSIQITQNIDALLLGISCKLPLHEPPLVGMVLAVKDPAIGYYRAVVTAVCGEVVDVHALDYGCTKSVAWRSDEVFEIVRGMGTEQYEPQATLCILKGVSPPPFNTNSLLSVASILRNLAAEAKQSFDSFGRLEVIRPLQYLAACPDSAVVRCAAQIISNMAHSEILRIKLNSEQTLSVLMVKMRSYFYSLAEEPVARATYSILGAINNLMCEAPEAREQFYTNKGLEHMVQLMGKGAPEQVQTAAQRVIAMFVGDAIPTTVINNMHERKAFPISQLARKQVMESMNALGMGKPYFQDERGATGVTPNGTEQPTRSRSASLSPGALSPKSKSKPPKVSYSNAEQQGAITHDHITEGAESDADMLSSLVGKKRIPSKPAQAAGGDSSDGEIIASLARPFTADGDDGALGLNTALVYTKFSKKQHYVKGRQVNFQSDVRHDIRPFEDVQKISRMQIMKAICGLLNTGEGGSVWMGLSQKGIVTGLPVDRDQRDVLRTSVDSLLSKLKPSVSCQMYDVSYHQVVEYIKETGDYRSITNFRVIEITVQPSVDMIHTLPNGEIMMRIDNKTDEITMQDLRMQTVQEAEERKLAEIETLETELNIWASMAT